MKIPTRRQVKVEFVHPIDSKAISFYKYFFIQRGLFVRRHCSQCDVSSIFGHTVENSALQISDNISCFSEQKARTFFENKSGCSICIYCGEALLHKTCFVQLQLIAQNLFCPISLPLEETLWHKTICQRTLLDGASGFWKCINSFTGCT